MLKPPVTGPELASRRGSWVCRRTLDWYSTPSNANLKNHLWWGLPGCESTHLSDPTTWTSPLGLYARGSVSKWSSWTTISSGRNSGVWDLKQVASHHLFRGRGSSGCRSLTRVSPSTGSQELSLLCPVRALRVYIERSASYRKSEQLFVGFGNHAKGGPVTKQGISRWLVDAVTLAYSSLGCSAS